PTRCTLATCNGRFGCRVWAPRMRSTWQPRFWSTPSGCARQSRAHNLGRGCELPMRSTRDSGMAQMSRWAEKFAALSRDRDRSDTLRHIAEAAFDVSRSVHSVARAPKPGETPIWPAAGAEPAAAVEPAGSVPANWLDGFARLHPDSPPPRC